MNSTCPICDKRFNASNKTIIVCYPCEHYYHKDCFLNTQTVNCIFKQCNSIITNYKTLSDFNNDDMHAINIMALSRSTYKPSFYDIFVALFYRAPFISYYIFRFLLSSRTYYNLQKLLTNVNNILNINLKITGNENNVTSLNKIYVSTHHSFLDALILPRCIVSGAVASTKNANNMFAKIMQSSTHVYFVDRGKSSGNVEKIESHIEKHGSLIVCPAMFSV